MESMNRSALVDLPPELLHRTLAELGNDSWGSLKSLRQTCHRLVVPASEHLFRRIRISRILHDRDNFLNVAGSPHLACHVRVLVWEEIDFDGNFAAKASWSTLQKDYPDLAIYLKKILWFPMLRPEDDIGGVEAVVGFRPIFEQALLAMPNLRTIVSEQMHPYRMLLPSRSSTGLEDYEPIPAHYLQRSEPPKGEDADILFNAGFFAFLVPAMSRFAQARSEGLNAPSITHLQVFFEQDRSRQNTWPLKTFATTAKPFSSLTHIDICISKPWPGHGPYDTEDQETTDVRNKQRFANIEARVLGILKGAAASITHLHLCRQNTWDTWGCLGRSILRILPRMPRLRALHLDGVYHEDTLRQAEGHRPLGTDEERATGYKKSALVTFVRAHRETLREVFINGTPVTFDVLVAMRKGISELQLERFEARPFGLHGNDDVAQTFVDEKDVLDFVNNRVTTISMLPTVLVHEGVERRRELTTVDMDEDELEIATVADMERHFPYWSRCCPRVKNPDPKDGAEEISEGRYDDVESAMCHREHIAHVRRQQLDRGWNFARDEHGKLWFRPATNGAHVNAESSNDSGIGSVLRAYPTELWLFNHRNGEQAYGDEPLDFWSDWEGSEAGDNSEATPFGIRLWDLAHDSPEKQPEEALVSILSNDIKANDEGEEGWVRYDESTDWPYVMEEVSLSLTGPLVTGGDIPLPGDGDGSYKLHEYLL